LADVSKQSADFGKRISASYINRIENNRQRPTPDRLTALANGLGVPVQELFARAIGVIPCGESSDELDLLTRFRELSAERQTDVLNIVDMWYSQELNNG
jgi:transcriptional regulator with XRE-family HTH domain